MNGKKRVFLWCAALLGSALCLGAESFDLTIFHVGDIHGHGFDEAPPAIGFAKTAAYVNQFRKTNKNVLFLDAGDSFSGTPDVNLTGGVGAVKVMKLLKLDALTLGNGDFVHGGQALLKLRKAANFPVLSANIQYKGKDTFKPYVIKKVGGLKIAIIGVSPSHVMVASSPSQMAGFAMKDTIAVLAKLVPEARSKADLVVLLSHIGKVESGTDGVTVAKIVEGVPGIDVIVDGHDHIPLSEGALLGDTIMVNAGQYNENLGVLTLTIDKGSKTIQGYRAVLLNASGFDSVAPDTKVAAEVAKIKAANALYLNRVEFTAPFELEGRREFVRTSQTNLGSVVTDAERALAKSDVDFNVGAFLRESIPAGEVTRGKVLAALPDTHPLVVRLMTGKQLQDILEHNYDTENKLTPAYFHVSGITFRVDFSRNAGDRMTDIKVGGLPFDSEKIYRVSCDEQVSDYGIWDIPVVETFDVPTNQIVIDYLKKNPNLPPPETRVIIR